MRCAVVVAGGTGDRFGRNGGKQLAVVDGLPVVAHALRAFDAAESIDEVVLVCHPDRLAEYTDAAVRAPGIRKVTAIVAGGATRRASVSEGLAALGGDAAIVAIHDGARPLVDPATIDTAVACLVDRPDVDGVVVGHPAYDTVKTVDASATIVGTPDRVGLWIAQTPQVFRVPVLRRAHDLAAEHAYEGTDDASLVERAGGVVIMLEGPRWNLKVTVPEDLAVVSSLLALRAEQEGR
jgi:2-C-methyl-D-erythritol 4-phosphate cytidylyltransferase